MTPVHPLKPHRPSLTRYRQDRQSASVQRSNGSTLTLDLLPTTQPCLSFRIPLYILFYEASVLPSTPPTNTGRRREPKKKKKQNHNGIIVLPRRPQPTLGACRREETPKNAALFRLYPVSESESSSMSLWSLLPPALFSYVHTYIHPIPSHPTPPTLLNPNAQPNQPTSATASRPATRAPAAGSRRNASTWRTTRTGTRWRRRR